MPVPVQLWQQEMTQSDRQERTPVPIHTTARGRESGSLGFGMRGLTSTLRTGNHHRSSVGGGGGMAGKALVQTGKDHSQCRGCSNAGGGAGTR